MSERAYWSSRMGRGPRANPTIEDVGRALTLAVQEMGQRDYLQEWYGYWCFDAHQVAGRAGVELSTHIETVLGRRNAWPLSEPLIDVPEDLDLTEVDMARLTEAAEDLVFDLIEFFHDRVSEGTDGYFHDYADCGWHYKTFDAEPAQQLFRTRMNALLRRYGTGFELTQSGEIQHTVPEGLGMLMDAPIRTLDSEIQKRVEAAIAKYRRRERTPEEQRDAVRDLFDVLEKLRSEVKAHMLTADESDLFNIANNFTIRHLNELQKGDYDGPLWLSWMFYVNLATIHLIIRLREQNQ